MPFFLALATILGQQTIEPGLNLQKEPSRFELEAPCPSVSAVMIDRYGTGVGLASEMAKNKSYQARVMWIDATANIERYNSPEKIHTLIGKIKDSGFNTVVLDIKPISGQTIYKTSLAPKLTDWRGQHLPEDYDPLPDMSRECREAKLSILFSMNAFSEGHRMFKVGPGYSQPEHQTVLYIPQPVLRIGPTSYRLVANPNEFSAGAISVVTSVAQIPKTPDGYVAILSPRQSVIWAGPFSTVPPNQKGEIIYANGLPGQFLQKAAKPGVRVAFDTDATYLPIGQQTGGQVPLMMNPNDSEVQDHALAMIKDVVSRYDTDGVIYDDRLRYSGLNGDFSPLSRDLFEKAVGKKLRWPDDVFKFTITPGLGNGIQPGPFYEQWLTWRASQVRAYVAKVGQTVRSANPAAQFGAYVGSWYGDYAALGHNYASPDSRAGFWFDTASYRSQGTAGLLDFLIVGCYYPTATIYDAMSKGTGLGFTVEASGALCNRLTRDETWTYAGIDCGMFAGDPDGLGAVVQAACASTQGVMVFDLSHGMDDLWPVFKNIFSQARIAPHQVKGALQALRTRRETIDRFHQPERPVIILNGSSGIGQ